MTATVVLVGAAAGLGIASIFTGLRPPRPSLSAALDRLHRPAQPATRGIDGLRVELAGLLARFGVPAQQTHKDLALLQRPPTTHLAGQATAAITGLLIAPLVTYALVRGASLAIPAGAAIAGAALGLWVVEARLRAEARRLRAELVHTLAAILDLVTISLAGGAGIEQATHDAANIAHGWAADRIRTALATSRLTRQPPWQQFHQLGVDAGIPELEELAASLTLAGNEGARIRASLAARAHALRTRQTIAMQAAANAASERMSLPLVMLGVAFMIFLLYPAVVGIGAAI
ncbi:type II secretion system F family protein [Phytohabitans houttuyneae]|uniref:Type II secretion system protein n=1 Tax=Phytohabitans houttuyneae TaxID=1076126 RepID=A0A6V8KT31_9ACTN|nr:type II secretion system F family protein [Phytohabitans houttuyneae]GFJ85808.1 type II secretion system protein [Phytohabitans houttuyneae]